MSPAKLSAADPVAEDQGYAGERQGDCDPGETMHPFADEEQRQKGGDDRNERGDEHHIGRRCLHDRSDIGNIGDGVCDDDRQTGRARDIGYLVPLCLRRMYQTAVMAMKRNRPRANTSVHLSDCASRNSGRSSVNSNPPKVVISKPLRIAPCVLLAEVMNAVKFQFSGVSAQYGK